MIFWRGPLLFAAAYISIARGATCPGEIDVVGYGPVSLVPAGWLNGPSMGAGGEVGVHERRNIVPHMDSRIYFANDCTAGLYSNKQYMAWKLLGKTIRYTVDLSGVGCGCNVAFYLTSLRQNTEVSTCSDFYCDANSVCGVACAEIDIMEANQYAWHSTLHSSSDGNGVGAGYGGGGTGWNGPRDWTAAQFSPGSNCIDTAAPFEVEVSFPIDAEGNLKAMEVTLSQQGHNCPVSVILDTYKGMAELSKALADGMTPIISYWKSDDMRWLDGEGDDKQGPCHADTPCSDFAKFTNFSVYSINGQIKPEPESTAVNEIGKDTVKNIEIQDEPQIKDVNKTDKDIVHNSKTENDFDTVHSSETQDHSHAPSTDLQESGKDTLDNNKTQNQLYPWLTKVNEIGKDNAQSDPGTHSVVADIENLGSISMLWSRSRSLPFSAQVPRTLLAGIVILMTITSAAVFLVVRRRRGHTENITRDPVSSDFSQSRKPSFTGRALLEESPVRSRRNTCGSFDSVASV